MPIIKVQTNVIGFLFDADVWLENQQIPMANDGGKNWQSTDILDVRDGKLNIVFHGRGVAGADWTFTIVQLEPEEKAFYKNDGTIGSNGHSLFADFVALT